MALATLSNLFTKIGIAWTTGGSRMGRGVLVGYLVAVTGGAAVLVLAQAYP
ncbi:hypothetical protein [Hydrogenophaga pseudoflava]|uniref:hypothetical protein n=1 Tax=Hydrogenophaga pseudoflava TaxID=47421 RepID=UPI0027E40355|nr:hypothetical protein [Hydrogenophaga pseudoflava]MDQ7746588.1 hypothetical protein [Hydrogenophaga pseudoflava]